MIRSAHPVRLYHGFQDANNHLRVLISAAGTQHLTELRHIAYHTEDGFSVGYVGAGPLDLALALLSHALHEHFRAPSARSGHYYRSLALAEQFAHDVLAFLPISGCWTLMGAAVDEWVRLRDASHPASQQMGTTLDYTEENKS